MTRTNSIFYVSNYANDFILVYCHSVNIARKIGREHFGSLLKECRPATNEEIRSKREVITIGE
jgi:hypothetical protein